MTEVSHQTAPDAPRRPRRGRKALWLGVIALASVVALLVIVFGPLQRVTVPDLLGKTPTEAAAILATSNLILDAQETDFSEDFAKGVIMSTDPGPESSARSGSTVQAVVSKGPERYEVPKLKKLTRQGGRGRPRGGQPGARQAERGLRRQGQEGRDHQQRPAGRGVGEAGHQGRGRGLQGPGAGHACPPLEGTDGDAAEATLDGPRA